MSCVAGLVHEGRVWMGGDSAATSENHAQFILRSPKVIVHYNYLLAPVGSLRLLRLLRFENPGKLPSEDPEAAAELVAEWISSLAEEHGEILSAENEREIGSKVLFGFAGRLYIVQEDFAVMEPRKSYTALGEGGPFAIGALSVLAHSNKNPDAILREALGISAQCCATVRPPFVIESV